jgi:hypothetical protein
MNKKTMKTQILSLHVEDDDPQSFPLLRLKLTFLCRSKTAAFDNERHLLDNNNNNNDDDTTFETTNTSLCDYLLGRIILQKITTSVHRIPEFP